MRWAVAAKSHAALLKKFIERGGTGNRSIDRFVQEDLATHAGERYSNTHLLLDQAGDVVAFASNAMGIVKLDSQELMERNMEPVSYDVPALFLHRLGVLHEKQRQGLSILLIYRLFETLRHVCSHTAAACVALYVDSDNQIAKTLYRRFFFQPVKTTQRKLELMALGYPEAMEQLAKINAAAEGN